MARTVALLIIAIFAVLGASATAHLIVPLDTQYRAAIQLAIGLTVIGLLLWAGRKA